MTTSNHKTIIKLLRGHPNSQNDDFKEFFALEDEDLCRLLFLNYRSSKIKTRGLRLTHQGLRIFTNLYKGWDIPIDEEYDFNSRWLIILERECSLPYYIAMKGRIIVVFEKEIGVMLKLNGGNILMIENMWTKPSGL